MSLVCHLAGPSPGLCIAEEILRHPGGSLQLRAQPTGLMATENAPRHSPFLQDKGQLPRGTCRAVLPAFCSLPAVPSLQPFPPSPQTCRVPATSHTQPQEHKVKVWQFSLRDFAPPNRGQTRSQPSCGGGPLHACFTHDSRGHLSTCHMHPHATSHRCHRLQEAWGTSQVPSKPTPEHSTCSESRLPQGWTSPASVQAP